MVCRLNSRVGKSRWSLIYKSMAKYEKLKMVDLGSVVVVRGPYNFIEKLTRD